MGEVGMSEAPGGDIPTSPAFWGLKKGGLNYEDENALVAALKSGLSWEQVKQTSVARKIQEPVLEAWRKDLERKASAPFGGRTGPVLPPKPAAAPVVKPKATRRATSAKGEPVEAAPAAPKAKGKPKAKPGRAK